MNLFYYDANSEKQGPVTPDDIRTLVKEGKIVRETLIETESGKRGKAAQIKGLFAEQPVKQVCRFYYYTSESEKQGPVTTDEIRSLVNSGAITRDTLMETEDGKQGYAYQIKGLFKDGVVPLPKILFYYDSKAEKKGPVSLYEAIVLIRAGKIKRDTLLETRDGRQGWAYQVKELNEVFSLPNNSKVKMLMTAVDAGSKKLAPVANGVSLGIKKLGGRYKKWRENVKAAKLEKERQEAMMTPEEKAMRAEIERKEAEKALEATLIGIGIVNTTVHFIEDLVNGGKK